MKRSSVLNFDPYAWVSCAVGSCEHAKVVEGSDYWVSREVQMLVLH